MNTEDGALRRINNGGREHGAEHAAVGNGEGTASQLFQRNLAVLGTRTEVNDLSFDVG